MILASVVFRCYARAHRSHRNAKTSRISLGSGLKIVDALATFKSACYYVPANVPCELRPSYRYHLMKITFACSNCRQTYTAGENALGKKIACRKCGETITVSLPSESPDMKTLDSAQVDSPLGDIVPAQSDTGPSTTPPTDSDKNLDLSDWLKQHDRSVATQAVDTLQFGTEWNKAARARRWTIALTIVCLFNSAVCFSFFVGLLSYLSLHESTTPGKLTTNGGILFGVVGVPVLCWGIWPLMYSTFRLSRSVQGKVVDGSGRRLITWTWSVWSNERVALIWLADQFHRVIVFREGIRFSELDGGVATMTPGIGNLARKFPQVGSLTSTPLFSKQTERRCGSIFLRCCHGDVVCGESCELIPNSPL